MSELIGRDEGSIVISGDNIPFDAYQAIYHKLTGKVEKLSKPYKDPVVISVDALRNLVQRMHQMVSQYQIKGSRVQIAHSTKDGYRNVYSSIDRFCLSDSSAPEYTNSLAVEFDFLIVLPSGVDQAKDVPQRYKLQVIFEQNFVDKDDDLVPFWLRDFTSVGVLRMELEYADYAVAQAVEATVAGWVVSLPKRSASTAIKFFVKIEQFTREFADTTVRSAAILAGAFYIYTEELSASASIAIGLFCIGVGFFSFTLTNYFLEGFYTQIKKFRPAPVLLVTQGDRNRFEGLDKAKRRSSAIMAALSVGGVLAFLVNIFAAWIFKLIAP